MRATACLPVACASVRPSVCVGGGEGEVGKARPRHETRQSESEKPPYTAVPAAALAPPSPPRCAERTWKEEKRATIYKLSPSQQGMQHRARDGSKQAGGEWRVGGEGEGHNDDRCDAPASGKEKRAHTRKKNSEAHDRIRRGRESDQASEGMAWRQTTHPVPKTHRRRVTHGETQVKSRSPTPLPTTSVLPLLRASHLLTPPSLSPFSNKSSSRRSPCRLPGTRQTPRCTPPSAGCKTALAQCSSRTPSRAR